MSNQQQQYKPSFIEQLMSIGEMALRNRQIGNQDRQIQLQEQGQQYAQNFEQRKYVDEAAKRALELDEMNARIESARQEAAHYAKQAELFGLQLEAEKQKLDDAKAVRPYVIVEQLNNLRKNNDGKFRDIFGVYPQDPNMINTYIDTTISSANSLRNQRSGTGSKPLYDSKAIDDLINDLSLVKFSWHSINGGK